MFVFAFSNSDDAAKLTVICKPTKTDSASVFLEGLCILIKSYICTKTKLIIFNKWILFWALNCNDRI